MQSNRKLILNYIFLFFFILFISLWTLNNYKQKEIAFYLKNDLSLIGKNYLTYIKQSENFSEILFYNHIFGNSSIVKTLKKQIPLEKKSEELYLDVKKWLNIFKKYNLKEINLYLPNGRVLLKSEYKGLKKGDDKKDLELIKRSIKDFKIISTFNISSTSASFKYIRPLFDKNLNLIAVVEIATNMPKLAFSMSKNINFDTFFIFNKSILETKLNKENIAKYKEFPIVKDYMYEDSIYDKTLIDELSANNKNIIEKKLYSKKKFAFNYQSKNSYSMIGFIPIKNSVNNEHLGYLVALGDNENYGTLLNKYDLYNIVTILLSIVFVLMLYFIHYFYIKLKASNSRFNDLYKSIDKHVIVAETDVTGIVTYVSQAFCKVSGYRKDEIIGRPINMLRNPDLSKKFFDAMWKTITKGKVWEGEIKNLDKNGNSYWVRGNIFPIFDGDKKIVGYRSIRVNITDEKQLQKVNEILKRDLLLKVNEIKTKDNSKVDESKVELMAQILDAFSNEWRKPISNISLSLMELENKINNGNFEKQSQLDYILSLTNETSLLSKQLNTFKSLFSQSNSQDKYNVYEVIKHILDSIYEPTIKIVLSGNKELESYGISFDFRKIMLGIIYNSIEQIKIKNINNGFINIYVSQRDEYIIVRCQDNAMGIPEKIIDKIFDLDFSTKDSISRNGITLHMAKLLIQKSDGDMWVENEYNGCSFYIKLITKDRRKKDR